MTKMQPDATIATAWPTLAHPQDYISGVSQRLYQCVKKHGNASVTIGVTGKSTKPCYRITYKLDNDNGIFGSWWDNHDALSAKDADSAHWSTRSMSFDQVGTLMHRHFKPAVARR